MREEAYTVWVVNCPQCTHRCDVDLSEDFELKRHPDYPDIWESQADVLCDCCSTPFVATLPEVEDR